MTKVEQKKQAIQIVKDLEKLKYTLIQFINDIVFKIEKILIEEYKEVK